MSDQNENNDNQRSPKRGGKRKRRSFQPKQKPSERVFLPGSDLRLDQIVSLPPKQAVGPAVGVELHSAHGVALEIAFSLLEKAELKSTMAAKNVQIQNMRNVLVEYVLMLQAAAVSYAAASATTTTHPMCQEAKQLTVLEKIFVDESLFDVLNAFMPVDNCVQMNVYHVVYILLGLSDAIQAGALWTVANKDSYTSDEEEMINATLFTRGDENPLVKEVRMFLSSQTSIVVETENELQSLAEKFPMYKYRVAGGRRLAISRAIATKTFDFQREHKPYYWKMVNQSYAVVRSENVLCSGKTDAKYTELLCRVSAVLHFQPPRARIIEPQMFSADLRCPFVLSMTRMEEVRDLSQVEQAVKKVVEASDQELAGHLEEMRAAYKQVESRHKRTAIVKPRASEQRREVYGSADADMKQGMAKKLDRSGVKVLIGNEHFYVDKDIASRLAGGKGAISVKKKYLRLFARKLKLASGDRMVLSEAQKTELLACFMKKDFDESYVPQTVH